MKELGRWQPFFTAAQTWQVSAADIKFACKQLDLPTNDSGFLFPLAGQLRRRFFEELERAPRESA